jgi:hypothetical protein
MGKDCGLVEKQMIEKIEFVIHENGVTIKNFSSYKFKVSTIDNEVSIKTNYIVYCKNLDLKKAKILFVGKNEEQS